jgi:hypothetical protein
MEFILADEGASERPGLAGCRSRRPKELLGLAQGSRVRSAPLEPGGGLSAGEGRLPRPATRYLSGV